MKDWRGHLSLSRVPWRPGAALLANCLRGGTASGRKGALAWPWPEQDPTWMLSFDEFEIIQVGGNLVRTLGIMSRRSQLGLGLARCQQVGYDGGDSAGSTICQQLSRHPSLVLVLRLLRLARCALISCLYAHAGVHPAHVQKHKMGAFASRNRRVKNPFTDMSKTCVRPLKSANTILKSNAQEASP